jgi:hypothetical protein
MKAMRRTITLLMFAMGLATASLMGQSSKYPPLSEYLMEPDAEISLAKSAAPEKISEHATIKVLTATGYKVVSEGDNGFVCIVMRAWSAPTFNPVKDRELVYYSADMLRSGCQQDGFALPGVAHEAWVGGQRPRHYYERGGGGLFAG